MTLQRIKRVQLDPIRMTKPETRDDGPVGPSARDCTKSGHAGRADGHERTCRCSDGGRSDFPLMIDRANPLQGEASMLR